MSDEKNSTVDHESAQDIRVYLGSLLARRKWLMLFLSLLGIVLTAAGTYLVTPRFKATSKILVRYNLAQEVVLFDDLYRQTIKSGTIIPANNFVAIAQSEQFARRIVDKFDLAERARQQLEDPASIRECFWAYLEKTCKGIKRAIKSPITLYKRLAKGVQPQRLPPDYRARAVKGFLGDVLEARWVAESDVISLTVWGEKPKQAEAISKELADMIVQQGVSMEQDAAAAAYEVCRRELEKARHDLAAADEALQTFKQKWDISSIDQQREMKLTEIHEVQRSVRITAADLIARKARAEGIERQLAEQKKLLTSVDSYQDLLDETVMLDIEINTLMATKQEYESAKAEIEEQLRGLGGKEAELKKLERQVLLKEQLLAKLGLKHDELEIQKASTLRAYNLTIIDTPELSERAGAAYPDWTLNMCLGIPGSILLAFGIAFLWQWWREPFWTE